MKRNANRKIHCEGCFWIGFAMGAGSAFAVSLMFAALLGGGNP